MGEREKERVRFWPQIMIVWCEQIKFNMLWKRRWTISSSVDRCNNMVEKLALWHCHSPPMLIRLVCGVCAFLCCRFYHIITCSSHFLNTAYQHFYSVRLFVAQMLMRPGNVICICWCSMFTLVIFLLTSVRIERSPTTWPFYDIRERAGCTLQAPCIYHAMQHMYNMWNVFVWSSVGMSLANGGAAHLKLLLRSKRTAALDAE